LLLEIRDPANFIVILSPGCFDIVRPDDWLIRKIQHALATGRRIVPIFKEGFKLPPTASLPPALKDFPRINGLKCSHDYLVAGIEKLMAFLAG
jgi:hypothetical protein